MEKKIVLPKEVVTGFLYTPTFKRRIREDYGFH